ncbi:hypothetical protein RSOLAG22IIIB_08697 [Rhizoctonia solani]|uniref:Uncharacterized protein n=1 Tax=Rhizoctonia solani TaxID=456999 RepID=A0A0K6FUP8_9AGAM|nr:hypothetical protein RSOLAG22IIIB_08697 [Rhizoctonia solani]
MLVCYFGFVPLASALASDNAVVRSYRSYQEAAREACRYILTGKIDSGPIDKQTPPAFTLYRYPSKSNQPAWINGKTIGLGFKPTPADDPIDFIRIEYDPKQGFYFHVQALTDDRMGVDYSKVELVAKFPLRAKDANTYFQNLVEPLERRGPNGSNEYAFTAVNIWDVWRSGRRFSLL